MAFDLQVLLSLVDNLTGPLQRPMQALTAVERQVEMVERGTQQMINGASTSAAGLAMAAPLALATNEAMKLESAMANVAKVVDFPSPDGLREMRNDLMDLSETIPLTAAEFATIAAAAGQAGIERGEIVRFAEDAAKMGVAFDLSADVAGGAMTGLRTIFKLTQDQVVSLGDSVNYLSNNMDAKASGIVDILNRAGGTGKLIGMTGQQVAALGATFLALKRPPEVAATGINALLLKLSTAEQQAKSFQDGLETIGLTAKQVKSWMVDDAQAGLLRFLETVKKSPDAIGTLGLLFGAEYADDVASLVGNLDTYRKALALSGDASGYAGSMGKEFEARANTTENAIQLLKNTLQNTATTIGDVLLPPVRQVTELITKATKTFRTWADANPRLAQVIVMTVGAVAALTLAVGNAELVMGGLNVTLASVQGGLLLLRTRAAAATVQLVAMRTALIGVATMGVPTAAQAALMATAWGRMRLAGTGLIMVIRGAAASMWAFTASLLANPITWVVLAIVGLGAAFVYAYRQSEKFRNTVTAAFVPLREAWAQLQGSLSSLWAALGPLGSAVSGFFARFQGPLDALGYALGWLLGFVLTGLVLLAAALARGFVDIFSGLIDIVTGAINLIVGIVTGDTDRMRLGVSQILMGLERIWTTIFNIRLVAVVAQWGVGLYQSVAGALTRMVAGIVVRMQLVIAAVQRGLNAARDWVLSTASAWREAGANIIDGLVGGIRSKVDGAVQSIRGLASQVRGAFTGDLIIRSPSRVFHGYGGHIVDGLALGIESSASRAVAASRALAAGVALAGAGTATGLTGSIPTATPTQNARVQAQAGQGGGRPSIVIENLTVQANDPQGFVQALQQLIEQHQ